MLRNQVLFVFTANACWDFKEIGGDVQPLHLYFDAFGKLHNDEDPTVIYICIFLALHSYQYLIQTVLFLLEVSLGLMCLHYTKGSIHIIYLSLLFIYKCNS